MTRLATRFVVLSTAGLLLSGCLVSGKDDDSPDKRNYVAMGDSYAAAPGVGRANPPLGCRKSKDNYPHKLADAADLDLTDVTCSGAPTEAVMTAYNALGDEVAPGLRVVTWTHATNTLSDSPRSLKPRPMVTMSVSSSTASICGATSSPSAL